MDDPGDFTDAGGDAHAGAGAAVCPLCGHMLSHYRDPEMSRGDQVASRIATITGTWGFLALLLLVVAVWYAAELIWSPGFDEPGALIRYLEIMLALLAAFLAPLILLVQRRGEGRDRARDREVLRGSTPSSTCTCCGTSSNASRVLPTTRSTTPRIAAAQPCETHRPAATDGFKCDEF